MSVRRITMEGVTKLVPTLMAATIVHVTMDMFLQKIIPAVLVCCVKCYGKMVNVTTTLDIDECQVDNGGCNQECNNNAGSYNCSCENGYELTDDNHTCIG